jgi:hypothetical protein
MDKYLDYVANISNYTIIGQIQDAHLPEEEHGARCVKKWQKRGTILGIN